MGFGLMTVAGVAGLCRALQRDSVRGLRSAFLLRLLRLGRGWFGFVRLTGVEATNWIDHRGGDRRRGSQTLGLADGESIFGNCYWLTGAVC
jgi:hypothetical protein